MKRTSVLRTAAAATALTAVALAGCGTGNSSGNARPPAKATVPPTPSANGSAIPRTSNAETVVATLLQLGINQADKRNWSAADATFNDVLAVSPNNVYALYNLGLVDETRGKDSDADSYYDEAIKANRDYTPALYDLAITLEHSQPAKAIDLYKRIISINPKASTAYLRLAFVYAREGKTQEAKSAQASAIAINPALGKYSLPAKQ